MDLADAVSTTISFIFVLLVIVPIVWRTLIHISKTL